MLPQRSTQLGRSRRFRHGQSVLDYAMVFGCVAIAGAAGLHFVTTHLVSGYAQVSAGLNGDNLVSNGYGQLGNNINFSTFKFDSANKPSNNVSGSFLCPSSGPNTQLLSDNFIPVNVNSTYNWSLDAMSGEAGGADYAAGNYQYMGVAPYDVDGNLIKPDYYSHFAGAADTTLAAQLVNGNTTITLANATGWQNAGQTYQRDMSWWPWVNNEGYSYPNYTYTRNSTENTDNGVGLWPVGGISGNTITLNAPWSGGTLPIGTPVRDNSSGGGYKYQAWGAVPNAWTHYQSTIGPLDTTGSMSNYLIPYGTTQMKFLLLCNWGATPNNVRVANVVIH